VIPLPEDSAGDDTRTVDNYIPAGSFCRAILLSGIDAPTGGAAQNNPVPFVVKLKDHGRLPNGFRSRIRSCHVVLAGYGDISSERVYARTETLSCVFKDGSVHETPLKGYISGEDGKAGMRGRLVSKQGALIARSLLAGIFGGIGEGVSESYKTVTTSALGSVATVDPDEVFKQGAAEGIGTALDRISKWYLERADETYPVIEADAARIVDIVLTQGADIGEMIEQSSNQPRFTQPVDAQRMKTATLERAQWKE
jgi:conjugal transfer pilus assembly protein TraB